MNLKISMPFLITRSLQPENQESPIDFLNVWKTPEHYFYLRNHFSYPETSNTAPLLTITYSHSRSRKISFDEILSMPSKTLVVPLECAGNKRGYFTPKTYGEQWEKGAISQGEWKGVPLKDLLRLDSNMPINAHEVVFEGSDCGKRNDMAGIYHYERSLPIEKALHPDTIIAYQYNNKPLSFKHGYPLRLIVPGWYAMASVKWLRNIKIINYNFDGPFQTKDYMYYPNKDNDAGKEPVTTINISSIIQQPLDYSSLGPGIHQIKGIAWTGQGQVTELRVSLDNGKTWKQAVLMHYPSEPYAWCKWIYTWHAYKRGTYTLICKAKDSHGRIQSLEATWNRKGYGYNAVSKVHVKIQ